MNQKRFKNSDVKMIQQILLTMTEHLIRYGVIDVEGKSIEALTKEILGYFRESNSKVDASSFVVIYHTSDLLKVARSYHKTQNYEYAFLFYALWFEHWLNGVIAAAATRKGLKEKEIARIIRETDLFKGKTTWLPNLLGLPSFNARHLALMNKIAENRNAFVHYKWQSVDINDDGDKCKQILINIEKTIKYFQTFERKFIFGKLKKSQLRKALSIPK